MKSFSAIALFCMVALAASCSFQVGTPKVDEVKIEKIEFAGNKDGKPGDAVTVFRAGETRQYFLLTLNGGKKDTKIRGTFIVIQAGEIKNAQIAQAEVTTENDSQDSVKFNVDVAAGFPAGTYKAEFTVDGKPGKTIEYQVE